MKTKPDHKLVFVGADLQTIPINSIYFRPTNIKNNM